MDHDKNQSVALDSLYKILQKLVGLHRQLLETVRLEKMAIIEANLSGVQEATLAKQAIIESIRQQETNRAGHTVQLAIALKKPARELTINGIILAIQGDDTKRAEMYRSTMNALTLLVQRIKEQSEYNSSLLQKSLKHIDEMKKNVLGETVPHSSTYGQKGQKVNTASGARLISKEA